MSDEALIPYGWSDRWAALLADADGTGALVAGRVVRHDGSAVLAATVDGIAAYGLGPDIDPPPLVGDWVALDGDMVAATLPRTSVLRRRDPRADIAQPLVANVDVVVIVCGLDRPVKVGRIQRASTLAWDAGAVPVVVLTKADLADGLDATVEAIEAENPGVEVVVTSSVDGTGIDAVAALAAGRTIVLLGESGAGKSTLTNALVGGEVAVTGLVRAGDAKGRHTTTTRELHVLPRGGVLIDTPGIRGVGLWADVDAVAATFDDIEALAEGCRFTDCAHDTEPGCAVAAAVAAGTLPSARLEQWRGLQREALALDRRTDPEAARRWGKQSGRMAREAQRRKRG